MLWWELKSTSNKLEFMGNLFERNVTTDKIVIPEVAESQFELLHPQEYLERANEIKWVLINSLLRDQKIASLVEAIIAAYEDSNFRLDLHHDQGDGFTLHQKLSLRIIQVFCSEAVYIEPVRRVFDFVRDKDFSADQVESNFESPDFVEELKKKIESLQNQLENLIEEQKKYTKTTNPETPIKALEASIEHEKLILELCNYCIQKCSDLKDNISFNANSSYLDKEGKKGVRFDMVIQKGDTVIIIEVKSNPEDWGSAVRQVARYKVIARRNGFYYAGKGNKRVEPEMITKITPVVVLGGKAEIDEIERESIDDDPNNIVIFNADGENPKLDEILDSLR